MASSSSSAPCSTCKYDVFPSFRGEDVRTSFLSHLLKELDCNVIVTFKDHGIERSRPIAPELLSAIRESNISIVIFSENYASSTWCLNELVEIHDCYEKLGQMVIPIFYKVDPSDVRKQMGEFGKNFEETCKGKTEDDKQRWIQALKEVASIAGEDSLNWSDEAKMIEQISKDVSNKLCTTTNDDLDDFVGIDAHIKEIKSKLCLESEGVRMVGIVGPSGIGKSTIARALYTQLSSQFHYRAFESYKRTIQDDNRMKLAWEEQFLSVILGMRDIKIDGLGMVKQRLKNKKVLVVLDDVEEIKLLDTLVGETGWFGNGSRIIVVTQDKALLNSHGIHPSLIYEVQHPPRKVALEMFCRSAFRQNYPPDDFMDLAVEVAELAGNLPLSLNVLGSSLRGKDKKAWEEMMPRIQGGLDDQIWKILKVCYDRLEKRDQELFLYIACLFNGESVNRIENLLEDGVYTGVSAGLTLLADKSLIRIIAPEKTVQMHILLQKLGKKIDREESESNLGKRRFLVDAEDIRHVLTYKTGTEKVLGICLNASDIDRDKPLFIDENSFKGMHNLKFLKIYRGHRWDGSSEVRLKSPQGLVFSFWSRPQGLVYLPHTLRLLHWDDYPGKYLPFSFSAEYLVELILPESKLKKLWEGTHNEEYTPLQRLKKMDLWGSEHLKEITNLSNATNLEELDLNFCTSLVTNPSSIRNLKKLRVLKMALCKLEFLPTDVNLKFLEHLDIDYCSRLTSFHRISKNISKLYLQGTAMEDVKDSLWVKNISGLRHLRWSRCPLRCMPSNFHTEHLVELDISDSKLEKLWEGVKPLENLKSMRLSSCYNLTDIPDLSKATNLVDMRLSYCDKLTDIPDLSKATNLEYLYLEDCRSLVMFPCSIWNCHMLKELNMTGCTRLEVLPTDVNLVSLEKLILSKCSQLRTFPQISTNIKKLRLYQTAIEEVPSWIENMSKLQELDMSYSERLKNISRSIFKLRRLKNAYFSHCEELTSFSDASVDENVARIPDFRDFQSDSLKRFRFNNCMNLDQNAQEFILQLSFPMITVLPGGEVPTYFTNQTCGSSLIIKLSPSCPSHEVLRFKACIVVGSNFEEVHVFWRLRGLKGVKCFDPWRWDHDMTNHLVVFNFELAFNSHPSELDDNDMKFQFLLLDERYEKDKIERWGLTRLIGRGQTGQGLTERVLKEWGLTDRGLTEWGLKGCGIRLLDDSQSLDAAATRISEI